MFKFLCDGQGVVRPAILYGDMSCYLEYCLKSFFFFAEGFEGTFHKFLDSFHTNNCNPYVTLFSFGNSQKLFVVRCGKLRRCFLLLHVILARKEHFGYQFHRDLGHTQILMLGGCHWFLVCHNWSAG